ncbi:MAG: efflux RND transporter periplasmic adaptor subunit [Planctomycetota bacterium]|nr:efflux RND transporter periplasmic adaptor subunit [Planctomycetota bacterium]
MLFVDWNPAPPPPTEIVRPVKTAVATELGTRPERRLRGEVLAGTTVDLAFQVSGPLIEANLALGQRVEEGAVLARIDPTRFEQQVATLRPQLEQAQTRLERIRRAVESQAASEAELIDAKAAVDAAAAQLKVAEQALADTVLRSPSEALIVARMAENFQNVQAGTPVVRLQDISQLDVAVDLPESIVAAHQAGQSTAATRVTFPVRPEKTYPVTVKEASAEADPQTGTYRVIYTMPAPTDLTVLPGMAATIILPARTATEGGQLVVPVAALFVNERGEHMVWRAEPEDRVFTVRGTPVTVVDVANESAIISQGLVPGARVVTAGVAFLREGQRVTLMEEQR